jgi:hypothetical protein
MSSSGLKQYILKVTLSNPSFSNQLTYEQTFEIRYGAATRFNMTSDTGGY